MGLFDKIKKATPAVGAATAAGAAAAVGVYASQAFAKDKVPDDQTSDPSVPPANQDLKASHNSNVVNPEDSNAVNPEATSFSTSSSTSTVKVEASEPQNQVDESPESTYNPETGVTTRHYPNGNILTEYPDGTRAWHDATSKETIVYNPETGESTTYEPDGDVVTKSPDASQVIVEADGEVFYRDTEGKTSTIGENLANEFEWDCTPDVVAIENNPIDPFAGAVVSASASSVIDPFAGAVASASASSVNELLTTAQNSTLDSNTLIQALGKQAGIPLEGQVEAAYEEKFGWEANYNKTHTGSDEIAPGVGLDSEASYNANFFTGAYSKGDAGAEWNSNQAHLHAHTRSMVGIEASQDASYKGTLNIEGVEHQPGVNANASTRAFAGAELEGQGDAVLSKDAAHASVGGNAFVGTKAEAKVNGALSVDGNDFARGSAGLDARAGIGVDGKLDMGYQDGQINFGMDAGVAAGLGVGYHYDVSVDAPGIVTHPDAVIASVQEEVQQYVVEQVQDYIPVPLDVNQVVNDFSTDPSDYVQHYTVQQVQDYVSVPQEVSQVVEVINEPVSVIEDIGDSFGVSF